ncbi:hypothetical protein V7S43_010241 [Phytophthora oleae]|uniref:Pectate lyase n=1 Tax=Phytophthora oleae TaxID=2107226 RepID=A0ABD3FC54_9STRA
MCTRRAVKWRTASMRSDHKTEDDKMQWTQQTWTFEGNTQRIRFNDHCLSLNHGSTGGWRAYYGGEMRDKCGHSPANAIYTHPAASKYVDG